MDLNEKIPTYRLYFSALTPGCPARAAPLSAEQQLMERPIEAVSGSRNWSGFTVYNASVPFKIEPLVGTYAVPVARNPFVQCPNMQYNV